MGTVPPIEPSAAFEYDPEARELKENRPDGETATNVSEYTATAAMIGAITPQTVDSLCLHLVEVKAAIGRTVKDPVGRKHAESAISRVMGAVRVAFPLFSGSLPPVKVPSSDLKIIDPTKP